MVSAGALLWWIDISSPSLWRLDPRAKRVDHWPLPKPPGSFALRKNGGFLFAFRNGFATLDAPGGALQWLEIPGLALGDERFNDGKVDRAGRFWAGTLDHELGMRSGSSIGSSPVSASLRWTAVSRISNGIGWSPDDRTMYFTDMLSRRIYRYDFDAATGGIANRRVFVEADAGHGGPDGMTVDAEGFVWSAQFDRWVHPPLRARRHARARGARAGAAADDLHVRRTRPRDAVRDERAHGPRRGGARRAAAGGRRVRARCRRARAARTEVRRVNRDLAGRVAVAGVGTTRYGKLPEYDAYDLGVWALKAALDDCGLGFEDIDGLIINRIPDYQRFGEITGINPRYTTITPDRAGSRVSASRPRSR